MARITKSEKREVAVEVARLSVIVVSRVYNAMDREKIGEKEVARRLGISTNHLRKLLDGDILPTLPMMVRLANVFGFHWNLYLK